MPSLNRRSLLSVAAASLAAPQLSRPAHAADLDRLVGPLLMLGFHGANAEAAGAQTLARHIASGAAGGACFLGHNTRSKAGIEGLTALFRNAATQRPPLLSVDQEGGVVQRLSSKIGYLDTPGATDIAERGEAQALAIYERMARMMRGAGFNLNLAPVVDLGFERRNPIIARHGRAYGDDGTTVARYAGAFCQAHRRVGVLTALKHFPGHGSTVIDSHKAPVDLTETWREDELEPYRQLVARGLVDIVMSGHLSHARMGGAGVAATLSKAAIEGVLRKQCGWGGVVMTDDVDMAAIRSTLAPPEAAVAALAAGNDIVLMSNSAAPDAELPRRVTAAIRQALADGRLTMARLEQANARVISLMEKTS
ncbi:MAG TPA: glycoside hydrolase family 3 N-terminal domain-containing protein [Beijerinckiaceae bacterium]|nr:glycoside hydrolase family 3 N-terminal domain-containing protein [Beijerinckiaceae bacterium]